MATRRVLITGGSGFLGRAIVRTAEQRGYDVLAPRRRELDLVTGAGADAYLEASIGHGPIDALIHAAAYYGGLGINVAEPATIFDVNGRMSLNIMDIARRYGIRKVLPVGSACAYPGYVDGALKEDEFWNGALHPSVEAYGFSKKLQLVGQHAYYKQFGIEGNHLVLTNLYGPHDVFSEHRSHVVAAMIKKFVEADDKVTLWGDGTPVREFLFVDDAAEAIVRALDLPHDLEPINVGTGMGIAIRDLASLIARIVGFQGDIIWDTTRPNGAQLKVLDVGRLASTLQWLPRNSLEEGLQLTIEWYRENKAAADTRE